MRSLLSWRRATTILDVTFGKPRAKTSCARSMLPDRRSPRSSLQVMPFQRRHTRVRLTGSHAGGAAAGGDMEILYPHCAGLDVHMDTVVACVRHMVNGSVRREVRSFKTTTKELLALSDWLAGEGCTHVAMEATGVYWKPVWHVLSDGDFTLVLANAAHVKNVPGRKTDVNDATWLADLLAHGLIRGSFVPDEQTQEMRTLLRTRKQLVRECSRHVQRAGRRRWRLCQPEQCQRRQGARRHGC